MYAANSETSHQNAVFGNQNQRRSLDIAGQWREDKVLVVQGRQQSLITGGDAGHTGCGGLLTAKNEIHPSEMSEQEHQYNPTELNEKKDLEITEMSRRETNGHVCQNISVLTDKQSKSRKSSEFDTQCKHIASPDLNGPVISKEWLFLKYAIPATHCVPPQTGYKTSSFGKRGDNTNEMSVKMSSIGSSNNFIDENKRSSIYAQPEQKSSVSDLSEQTSNCSSAEISLSEEQHRTPSSEGMGSQESLNSTTENFGSDYYGSTMANDEKTCPSSSANVTNKGRPFSDELNRRTTEMNGQEMQAINTNPLIPKTVSKNAATISGATKSRTFILPPWVAYL